MKKIIVVFSIAIVVVFLIIWSTVGVVAVPSFAIYGDANGDHRVTMGDVVRVERIILGYDNLTVGADANINGEVNMGDVTWIERQILRLEPVYGDANGDLVVNHDDILYTQEAILNLKPKTKGCDANRDGRVTISDATTIELMIR